MSHNHKNVNDRTSRLSPEQVARRLAADSLTLDKGSAKAAHAGQGCDPYNTSGSFDRKKNRLRVGKR